MNFSVKLATNLLLRNVQKSPQNVAISPLSLSAVAAMFGAGSSGKTLEGVLKFAETESLGKLKQDLSRSMSIVSNCSYGGRKLPFYNELWADYRFPLKSSFCQFLNETFRRNAETRDFVDHKVEAARDTNSWAEEKTWSTIKSIILENEINPLTPAIITNALYFKGVWSVKFDPQFTKPGDFYLGNGEKVSDVPYMAYFDAGVTCLPYGSFLEFDVVEIPYQKGDDSARSLSMQIILPHETDGLQYIIEKFDSIPQFLNEPFKLKKNEINVFRIPKFKFCYTLDNVRFPFMEGEVDLGEMFEDDKTLARPMVSQKVCIEVDEEGTNEAKLAFLASGGYLPTEFVADHPFMFIIKEDISGTVLFSGAVINPLL